MRGEPVALHLGRVGAGGMQECAAGTPRPVDNFLGQDLEVIAVIRLRIADCIDQSRPAAADANHFVAFACSTNSDRPDRRVQSRNIAAACQNADHSFCSIAHISLHEEYYAFKPLLYNFTDKDG